MTLTEGHDMRLGQQAGHRDGREERTLSCRLAAECAQTLAAATLEMAELPANADLFQFIGPKVHAMIREGVVAVNSIEGRTLTPQVLLGVGPVVMRLAQRLLGRPVVDMPIDGVHDVARSNMLTGKLERVQGGLYEMFFRTVPRPICWTLEKIGGVQECYSIGLRRSNQLFGNITILRQEGTRLHAETIEAFVNQASAVLERRRMVEALLQTEQRFRLLYESVQAGVVLLRADGTIVHANRMAGEICGVAPEAVRFKTLADLGCRMILEDGTPVPCEDYPCRITLRTGQPVRGAVRGLVSTDASRLRWLLINTEPLRHGDTARIEEVLVTFHDITSFKRAQHEIESSQRFLQTILNSFPGNVAVIDDAGIVVTTNDSWVAFGQMNRLDPRFCQGGWNYLEVCRAAKGPEDDNAREAADAIEAILHGQRNYFEMEYPCHSPDRKRWFHLHIQGFVYENRRWAVLAHIDITDRQRTRIALQQSDQRYRQLFEMSPESIALIDADGKLVNANTKLFQWLGYDRDEIVGKDCFSHPSLSGPSRARAIENSNRRKRGEQVEPYEVEFTTKGGETRVGRALVTPFFDEAGRLLYSLLMLQDVTKERQAQEALRQSEERYRLLFENASDLIFVHELTMRDEPKRFIVANQAAAERTGYSQEELLKLTPFDVMVEADAAEFCRETALLQQKNELLSQRRLIAKSGEIIPVEIHARVFQFRGKLTIISMAHDITERKQAEAALVESEEQFHSLFENSLDAVLLTVPDGRILAANIAACRMFGRTEEEIRQVGRSGAIDVTDARLPAALEERARTGRFRGELTCIRKDGTKFPGEISTAVFKDKNGHSKTSMVICDITQRKEAERQLVEYQRRLRALMSELALAEERERRRIGIGLHDQVGQSLAMTKFALQALAQSADPATAATLNRICDDVDGQIERVRSLSFELSDSILYEVGFKEAVEAYLMREIQQKHGIACRLSAEGDFSMLQNDAKVVLFRNLRELLANVVKHAKARHVEVRITAMAGEVSVSLEDDGIGFQPEGASHAGAKQTHFGLFSVAEQLRFLGGWLEVHSAPGRGTHIVMTAPL